MNGIESGNQLGQRRAQPWLVEHTLAAPPFVGCVGRTWAGVLDERRAVDDELHREEPMLTIGQQLIQSDQVFVRDVGQRAELALEAVEVRPFGLAEYLEGDTGRTFAVEGFVDDTEPAFAETPNQLEALGAGEDSRWHYPPP